MNDHRDEGRFRGLIVPAPEGAPERIQPPVSPAAEPFWDATRHGSLVLQWCLACEQVIHFPREACPRCLGSALELRSASGLGTVYALSEMTAPGNAAMAGRAPYLVVLVDLDEGARLLSNLVDDPGVGGAEASSATVGARVRVAWEPLADGRHLPVFVPAAPS